MKNGITMKEEKTGIVNALKVISKVQLL